MMDEDIERYIAAANTHCSDTDTPENAIGDLEQMLRAAWIRMTPAQRTVWSQMDQVRAVLAWEVE